MDLDTLIHNFKGHLNTINNHKRMVMEYCFRVGLYKQGLLHDLSKYSPQEFIPGVIYYQGDRSPNNAQREALGYSDAWLHHKGHNKHHYEYWIDYPTNKDAGLVGMKMPVKYVVEMFCDRVGACKTYKGKAYTSSDPYDYFMRGNAKNVMHPETAALLEKLLVMLRDDGEKKVFRYIRKELMKKRDY